VCAVKIAKIVENKMKNKEDMINPSGGHHGRDKNTILGHENSRIAK
jgi:hypothetical protein